MDFEAIDRDMSCWVVTTMHQGVRFYISDNEAETATDILSNAKRYRFWDQAKEAAERAERELTSWFWEPKSVPAALAEDEPRPITAAAQSDL